jgi:hypothetical protein
MASSPDIPNYMPALENYDYNENSVVLSNPKKYILSSDGWTSVEE